MKTYPQRLRRRKVVVGGIGLLVGTYSVLMVHFDHVFNGNWLAFFLVQTVPVIIVSAVSIVWYCRLYSKIFNALREDSGALDYRVCTMCLYDLRGARSGRCPECGQAIPDDLEQRWRQVKLLGAVWAAPSWNELFVLTFASVVGVIALLEYAGYIEGGAFAWPLIGTGAVVVLVLALWLVLRRKAHR